MTLNCLFTAFFRGSAMKNQSVRPSVKRVHCDKTEERSIQIFIPYEISCGL